MEVNGICCATLGHGIKGQNIEHEYFGSERVLNDLKRFENFEMGFVQFGMD